jgi:hypothetical protein
MEVSIERLGEIRELLAPNIAAQLSADDFVNLRSEARTIGRAAQAGQLKISDRVGALELAVDAVERLNRLIEERDALARSHATEDQLLQSLLASGPPSEGRASVRLPSTAAMATARPANAAPVHVTGGEPRIFGLRNERYMTPDEFAAKLIEAHDDLMTGFVSHEFESNRPVTLRLGRIERGEFDADRRLTGATESDTVKVSRVLNGAEDPARWRDLPEAVTASGGFCAPAQPDYDIPLVAGTQRPLHDYLPAFQADRGQVISIVPPALSVVASSSAQAANSAISVWPNSVDTTPGGSTKPFQAITCPSNVTTAAEAIVEQLRIGNFEARAFPELVKTWMGLAAAAWARRAEGQILNDIHANVTASVTTPQLLGAARDFLGYLSQAAALYRYRNRMAPDAKLRVLAPAVLQDIIAADFVRQAPGDAGGDLAATLAVGRDKVTSLIQSKDVNVTWYEDVSDSVAASELNHYVGTQGNTELKEFPLDRPLVAVPRGRLRSPGRRDARPRYRPGLDARQHERLQVLHRVVRERDPARHRGHRGRQHAGCLRHLGPPGLRLVLVRRFCLVSSPRGTRRGAGARVSSSGNRPGPSHVRPQPLPQRASCVQPRPLPPVTAKVLERLAASPMASPACWAPDPYHRAEYRWWDGTRWTDHVASGGVARIDAPTEAPTP